MREEARENLGLGTLPQAGQTEAEGWLAPHSSPLPRPRGIALTRHVRKDNFRRDWRPAPLDNENFRSTLGETPTPDELERLGSAIRPAQCCLHRRWLSGKGVSSGAARTCRHGAQFHRL
jgi:hypothetical protein